MHSAEAADVFSEDKSQRIDGIGWINRFNVYINDAKFTERMW